MAQRDQTPARRDGFGKSVTVPGQGTYTVQSSGAIEFDPLPAFRGRATPITYRVTDSHKSTATATLGHDGRLRSTRSPSTTSAITPFNQPITVKVLANDKAGDASAPLDPGSVVLKDPADGVFRKKVTRPGEGSYTAAADGSITFTPVEGLSGRDQPSDVPGDR